MDEWLYIENLDELLNSEDLNDSVIKLDNLISRFCEYGNRLDKLSEPQISFYYNRELESEINNGGFDQYFFNSAGNFSHETVISLKAIGALKTADILQQAINVFPGQVAPKDRYERQDVMEQIESRSEAVWESLDKKFYGYEDDLNFLNIEYLRKNKGFF